MGQLGNGRIHVYTLTTTGRVLPLLTIMKTIVTMRIYLTRPAMEKNLAAPH